jgi:hypothetical protein
MRALTTLLALVSLPTLAAGLNDTGQTSCYDASHVAVACDAAGVGSDSGVNPRQDARFGRDAKNAAGTLTKVGGGAAGFDFSKVCWNGAIEGSGTCTGTLLANTGAAASGTPTTDWACTKDNVTNLIWSLQTVSNIDWDNATSMAGGSTIATHNTASRCGFNSGWRVPTRRELFSIVYDGAGYPAIDTAYFPSTVTGYYWSNDVYVPDSARAWFVVFSYGDSYPNNKANTHHVRLVRSGE